ncbi:hypothetical protein CPB83DRAFT_501747 [Crepidotus variabilis]|uniref:Uncharacterized protein n=1 Tax=Crepidotus variabilis TaxID=179855 RepID=A0A9P6JMU0_9AGAR|nr:hypothetical protein CPB83DRAFT_501747 [Crepidotus variabilis]
MYGQFDTMIILDKQNRVTNESYRTVAYTFTDYKSHVIIGPAKPLPEGLSPFNVYVVLSRSRGRDDIKLLRRFDHDLPKAPVT